MEIKASLVEHCGDSNPLIEPRRRDVVHAVFKRSIGAHVMDHPLRGNHNAVSALFDALDVVD
jgi:hypothetical protein